MPRRKAIEASDTGAGRSRDAPCAPSREHFGLYAARTTAQRGYISMIEQVTQRCEGTISSSPALAYRALTRLWLQLKRRVIDNRVGLLCMRFRRFVR